MYIQTNKSCKNEQKEKTIFKKFFRCIFELSVDDDNDNNVEIVFSNCVWRAYTCMQPWICTLPHRLRAVFKELEARWNETTNNNTINYCLPTAKNEWRKNFKQIYVVDVVLRQRIPFFCVDCRYRCLPVVVELDFFFGFGSPINVYAMCITSNAKRAQAKQN